MKLPLFVQSTLAVSLMATLATAASAADWPQWRGIEREGKSPEQGLLQQWPAGGPPLAWKIKGIGGGFSGVSVAGGKIFTMGDGNDASYVYALDQQTGKQLWAAKVGGTGGGDGHPGPRCTPTYDGDLVFAMGQFGDLVCVETATGKERWRKHMVSDFGGKMMSDWGYSESPLVDGDRVVCTPGGSGGTVIALNKKTGAEVWRTTDLKDPAAYTSIIIAEIDGQRQYIHLTGASLVGIAPETGKLLWRARRAGSTAVITTPVYHDNTVFVTSYYGVGCNLFKITSAGGQFKAEQAYANKLMSNHHGGVIRIDENIYGYSDGKGWVCMEMKSGKSVWEEKGQLGKGAITYADGRFYLRGEGKGTMVLLEASPKGYKEAGRFEQPDRSNRQAWPHPVIADGKLYLRDQDVLLCYDIKKK